jgi:STE24 endopeptidase
MTDIRTKAKSYWRARYIAAAAGLAVLFIFLISFQSSGLSSALGRIAASLAGGNFHLQVIVYLAVFGALSYILMLPVDIVGGYVIEHRYGLSDQKMGSWFTDEMKKAALSGALSLALIAMLYSIAAAFPRAWWIIAALMWSAVSVALAGLFPVLVLPMFYKYKPLSDNALRKKTLDLAAKFDISVIGVFEIDYSKTTRKSNAAVIGWGASRRIIMADNLVNEFAEDEAISVLAHEMAHHKHAHMWIHLFTGAVSTAAFFFLLDLGAGPLASLAGTRSLLDVAAFPTIYMAFVAYGLIASVVHNAISRGLERDADRTALEMTGRPDVFISLMERLAEKNLADAEPNRIIELLMYSHPSVSRRIAMARGYR